MRQNRFKVVLLIMGLLLSLACVFTELFQSAPTPTTSHVPLAEGTPQPVVYRGTTDQEGKAIVADSHSEQAIVQVEDEDSRLPVSGIEVYFMQRGSSYLAIAIDPEGRYLTSWSQGSLEELKSSNSSLTTAASFLHSRPAYAQSLPLVLLLAKLALKVSSLKDLVAFLQNPPELDYWGWLYEDRCWTGEQLANYVGAVGLVLPGVDKVGKALIGVGEMDEIMVTMLALGQYAEHRAKEEAKDYLLGLDRPLRIRTYHLPMPIPILGIVYAGRCEPEATSTATVRALPVPTSVPIGGGGKIAYVGTDGNLWIMNVDGSDPKRLTTLGKWVNHPRWFPDGNRLIFTTHGDTYIVNADGSGLTRMPYDYEPAPSISPDGRKLAGTFEQTRPYQGGRAFVTSDLVVSDIDGSNRISLTGCSESKLCSLWGTTWSPDGQWIAFSGTFVDSLPAGGNHGIYVIRADGSDMKGLVFMESGLTPSWSPDGTKIAFVSAPPPELYVMNSDGSNISKLPFADPYFVGTPTWSPDSTKLAVSNASGTIYIINADGSQPLAIGSGREPAWSPR